MKFNAWSKDKIINGHKRLTSRKTKYDNDPDVEYVVGPLPWKFIRDYLWFDEGADTNMQLQKIIDKIFARRGSTVGDDEQFFVHVLNDSVYERLKK